MVDLVRTARRLVRRTSMMACAALVAACTVPGMQMNVIAPDNDNPGGAPSADLRARADLYTLDANTIVKIADEQRVADAALAQVAPVPSEPDAYVYRLGPQDVLRITVWDHPELTNPTGTANELSGRIVNSDGTFFFPFVGKVFAEGKTVQEVRDALARSLAPYLKNPQVDVSVLQYRSKRVFIAGEVKNQGQLQLTDVPIRVTDAIAQSGGLTPEADLGHVSVTRGSTSFRVDLYALYYDGKLRENMRLEDGDVINVPDRRYNKIFVLGEVTRPNSLVMPRGRVTLAEALSDAGGVNQLTGHSGQIYVIRNGRQGRPQIFHLNAASPEALVLADRFDLRARDVVFVDATPTVRWARVVNDILPSLDFGRLLGEDIRSGFRK